VVSLTCNRHYRTVFPGVLVCINRVNTSVTPVGHQAGSRVRILVWGAREGWVSIATHCCTADAALARNSASSL